MFGFLLVDDDAEDTSYISNEEIDHLTNDYAKDEYIGKVDNNDANEVVVKKKFLGHPQKFQKFQKFKIPFSPSNSSELILTC